MSKKYIKKLIIILLIFSFIAGGFFALKVYINWHYKKHEANVDANHDTMKYFVDDKDSIIRIAFDRLEKEFNNPNDFNLTGYYVTHNETIIDNIKDTIHLVYFNYYMHNNHNEIFFSKLEVLKNKPELKLFNINIQKSDEYNIVKRQRDSLQKRVLKSTTETFESLRIEKR